MKVFSKLLLAAGLVTAASSCKSFLDINDNPNQPTTVTPDAILAQALTATAANYNGGASLGAGISQLDFNSYGSFVAGYWGKSGTVSGYAPERTYTYSSNYQQNLWTVTYRNLNDYNIIQQQGTATGYPRHAAIARIMKVYNFLLLVDEYGDIPYTNALQGSTAVAPSYDKAADIYKDFIVQLKGAVADINAVAPRSRTVGPEDVVFGGDMVSWKRFANSLRLRILLRESQTTDAALNTFVAAEMKALQTATDGFITTDVVVQPGFASNAGQSNPFYNNYGFSPGLSNPNSAYSFVMPTNYIISQYLDNSDPRIGQLYEEGKDAAGDPAYVGTDLGEQQPPLFDPTSPPVGSRFLVGGTFLRAATAPTVLMLLAEDLFNQAEVKTRGLFTGGDAAAQADFNNGIKASFMTTYRDATTPPASVGMGTAATPGVSDYTDYLAANTTNPLVSYQNATRTGALGKQAIIIYQKYLAENTVTSIEAWNDYRRTGQPKFKVSLQSSSPRADKLPTRLLYPQTEFSTNATNVPKGITQYTLIFWDPN